MWRTHYIDYLLFSNFVLFPLSNLFYISLIDRMIAPYRMRWFISWYLHNYRPTILHEIFWTKIKILVKIRQEQKTSLSIFAYFLAFIAKALFLEGSKCRKLRLQSNMRTFNICKFNEILNLKSFANSFGNSYTKFVILDIKLCLTCGDWNL